MVSNKEEQKHVQYLKKDNICMEDHVPNVQLQWRIVSNVQKELNVKHVKKHIIQMAVVVQHLLHKDVQMIGILVMEIVLNV